MKNLTKEIDKETLISVIIALVLTVMIAKFGFELGREYCHSLLLK